MSSGMRLRSSIPPEQRELEKEQKKQEAENKLNRPYLEYSGKIRYKNTFIDCAMACDELLKLVNETTEDTFILGFDMEWPMSWKTGPGKTALIQISPNLNLCYLLHLPGLKSLPKGFYELLHHPKTKLTGVNIKNDVRKLTRDYSGFDVDKLLNSCVDSGVLANQILPCRQRWSMEKLIDYVLKLRIDKSKHIRMSKWHLVPLTNKQIKYAAIDAYASLRLYQELKDMEKTMAIQDDVDLIADMLQ